MPTWWWRRWRSAWASDRSDVRFAVHAAASQSLEHYQQESGRAGRDGLESSKFSFRLSLPRRLYSWYENRSVDS
jgi:ATP-dependent DNA helicase RecQ